MFDVVLAVETYFCFEAYVLNHKIEVYYALIPLLTQRYDFSMTVRAGLQTHDIYLYNRP